MWSYWIMSNIRILIFEHRDMVVLTLEGKNQNFLHQYKILSNFKGDWMKIYFISTSAATYGLIYGVMWRITLNIRILIFEFWCVSLYRHLRPRIKKFLQQLFILNIRFLIFEFWCVSLYRHFRPRIKKILQQLLILNYIKGDE